MVKTHLIGLAHDPDKLSSILCVVRCEIGESSSLGSCSTGSTNAVDIVFDVVGEVIVDDRCDILDVLD